MTIAEILQNAFNQFFPAPIEAWQDFANCCERKTYPKDAVLKPAGETERYFYFIISGSAGIFLWKENNFVCLDFGFENHFFGDYMSLLTHGPTPLQTMVLEDSDLLRISADDYRKLGQTPIGNILNRVAAESSYVSKQQQQIDLLTKTAEQRYQELFESNPEMIQRVAQKHLASYLGITPQSFSRIRRNIK